MSDLEHARLMLRMARKDLTDFAVQFRYEAFEGLGRELDRLEITHQVTELVEHVDKLLQEKTC